MSEDELEHYHDPAELGDLADSVASEVDKVVGGADITSHETTTEEGEKYVLVSCDIGGTVLEVEGVSTRYPLSIGYPFNIAARIGSGVSEETRQELISEYELELPVDPEEEPTVAAGIILLSNLSENEQREYMFQLAERINTPYTDWQRQVHDGFIYNYWAYGYVFPSEETHSIQHTSQVITAVGTAGVAGSNFIKYTFGFTENERAEFNPRGRFRDI